MMLNGFFKSGDWFAAKRFGYGAGLPIAWQGWLVYALSILAIAGPALLPVHSAIARLCQFGAVAGLIVVLILIVARHTRGGWRWRWGGD